MAAMVMLPKRRPAGRPGRIHGPRDGILARFVSLGASGADPDTRTGRPPADFVRLEHRVDRLDGRAARIENRLDPVEG